jgi:predicted enzyme related to lactoylglutathione lyase
MDFVSVRVITHDVERLATFWEQLTGLPVTRPIPVFAELRTPTGTIAIGAPATVGMLGHASPVPGQNRSVFVELRVDDVDATWERIKGLVPQTIPEIVLEPTDMPWGNRSVVLRGPDGGLVNLFTPATPEARANTASDQSLAGAATTAGTHRQATRCSEEQVIVPARTAQAGLAAPQLRPAATAQPDAKAHRAVSLWPAARLVLPDRDVLRLAVFSQIHDQPNTDSAFFAKSGQEPGDTR